MTVTDTLLRVYRVDQRINGLQSRLRAAERFLEEQARQAEALRGQSSAISGQLRQLKASASDAEGEAARLEAKIHELRGRMGTSKTNKEYQALLTEVNTYKDAKNEHETRAVELLEKIEQLEAQQAGFETELAERERVRAQAEAQRDERRGEIAGTLSELEGERATMVSGVPADALATYTELSGRLGDEAMAPIEILDRKRHEYTCGACMVIVPVETMSSLLSHGQLTRCVSCGAILFLEENTRERMTAKSK